MQPNLSRGQIFHGGSANQSLIMASQDATATAIMGNWWITCTGITNIEMLIHDSVPSGKHTKSYWTWQFIVDLTIENGDFP